MFKLHITGTRLRRNLPVNGLLIRFLSFGCEFNDEDVELIEADEDEGDDIVDTVDEVEDLCKSIGDGLSSASVTWCRPRCWHC